jgi:thymidylate synthase ThyX
LSENRTLKTTIQSFDAYAHLPRINHPDGSRQLVDDPDLWFASKINATLKTGSASDTYWEKKSLTRERQIKFVEGVRKHSWNRQHMGSMLVSGIDFETVTSSLVSSTFTLGKFYRMQQQTRRSVVLTEVVEIPALSENDEVKSSYKDRFEQYWEIVDSRPTKYKGFDPYIQDSFKILPLSVKTRFSGNLDLRSAKGYSRWRNLDYLPHSVKDFSNKMYDSIKSEYPIMFESFQLDKRYSDNEDQYKMQLRMAEEIGSTDLMDEPMLWYSDHSFLLPENKHFKKLYASLQLNQIFKEKGPDAMFMGYFNPLGLSLEELLDLFKNKDEASKSALEMASFAFVSKIDISGGIDTWRHTRSNRIVQPIYHALENNPIVDMPILYRRQQASGSDIPDRFMELSEQALDLYFSLVKQGIEPKEAINVLPHNFELIQIEMMDVFSFLNVMAIRTCVHARPEVQEWAKALLREVGNTPDFRGIDNLSDEKSNLLARGIVFGYCAELGNCTKCGRDKIYLQDPFVK